MLDIARIIFKCTVVSMDLSSIWYRVHFTRALRRKINEQISHLVVPPCIQ
jgi:hypothetical protein